MYQILNLIHQAHVWKLNTAAFICLLKQIDEISHAFRLFNQIPV